MRVAFLTVGNPERLTGGYLYHARVFATLRERGIAVDQIVVSADASLAGQRIAAQDAGQFSERVMSADVVVVDALAAVACQISLAEWQAERPLVAMVHELPSVAGDVADNDLLAAEERLLGADLVIAVSRHGASIVTGRGVRSGRVHVVPPGCDRVGTHPPDRHRSGGVLRVLAVGQWIPRKGIATLVQAWGRIVQTDARLELIGEPGPDPEYEALVRGAIGTTARTIDVRGTVTDAELSRAYAAADLFALPSRKEGYGMVYAEALLHGLPVVACDTGPVPELLGPDAGLLVPPGDPALLAAALDRLLSDDVLRGRMSEAAFRRGRELPTWADTAAGFECALSVAIDMRAP